MSCTSRGHFAARHVLGARLFDSLQTLDQVRRSSDRFYHFEKWGKIWLENLGERVLMECESQLIKGSWLFNKLLCMSRMATALFSMQIESDGMGQAVNQKADID